VWCTGRSLGDARTLRKVCAAFSHPPSRLPSASLRKSRLLSAQAVRLPAEHPHADLGPLTPQTFGLVGLSDPTIAVITDNRPLRARAAGGSVSRLYDKLRLYGGQIGAGMGWAGRGGGEGRGVGLREERRGRSRGQQAAVNYLHSMIVNQN